MIRTVSECRWWVATDVRYEPQISQICSLHREGSEKTFFADLTFLGPFRSTDHPCNPCHSVRHPPGKEKKNAAQLFFVLSELHSWEFCDYVWQILNLWRFLLVRPCHAVAEEVTMFTKPSLSPIHAFWSPDIAERAHISTDWGQRFGERGEGKWSERKRETRIVVGRPRPTMSDSRFYLTSRNPKKHVWSKIGQNVQSQMLGDVALLVPAGYRMWLQKKLWNHKTAL